MSLEKLRNAVKAAGLGAGGAFFAQSGATAGCQFGCDTTCQSGSCTTQCTTCTTSCTTCKTGTSVVPGEGIVP